MIKEDVVAFDSETLYTKDYSLKKMPVFQYVGDDRFNCYLVSVYTPTYSFVGSPREFDWALLHDKILLAHNAMFDRLVFERMQEQGIVPRHIRPKRWICTADMAAYFRVARALDSAAKYLLKKDLSKDVRAKMRDKVLRDIKGTTLEQQLLEYALRDASTCYELYVQYYPSWPESERRISEESRNAGLYGVNINRPLLEAGIATIQDQLFEAEKCIPWEWNRDKTPLAVASVRNECRVEGIECPASLAIDNPECADWEEKYAGKYSWIKALRDWRRLNMIRTRLNTMRNCMRPDGFMSYALKYFGANTGRWSGDQRYNIQNLAKTAMFGINLRHLIIADPGEILLIFDFAQVEAIALAWVVENKALLDLVARGMSIYMAHAVETMGWNPAIDLKSADRGRYALAKVRVLLLGYGGGPEKFRKMAKKYKVYLEREESEQVVKDYRKTNPGVVNFWRMCDKDLRSTVRRGDPAYNIILHSGRKLTYWKPHSQFVVGHENSAIVGQQILGAPDKKLYGALITENIIQALCRDILVDRWLALIDAGFKVKFTCHDEFVISHPIPTADKAFAEISDILSTPPDWAKGFPLSAEGTMSPMYIKGE